MSGAGDVLAVVAGHEAALLRTAYLLTGDRRAAEELVTGALARAPRRRRRAGGDPAAAVRRDLVRRWLRHPDRPHLAAPPGPLPDGGAEQLRQALLALPPRVRAAVVLGVHDRLAATEAAAALGCPPAGVAALVEEGSSALHAVLPPDLSPAGPTAPVTPASPTGDPDAIYRRPG